jgi:hypothetical protein
MENNNKLSHNKQNICFECFSKMAMISCKSIQIYIRDNMNTNSVCHSCCMSRAYLISVQLCNHHNNCLCSYYDVIMDEND